MYGGDKHFVILSSPETTDGSAIADVETFVPFEEQWANARLIAAAPELLEALEDAQEALDGFYAAELRLAGEHFGAALHERMCLAISTAKGKVA